MTTRPAHFKATVCSKLNVSNTLGRMLGKNIIWTVVVKQSPHPMTVLLFNVFFFAAVFFSPEA